MLKGYNVESSQIDAYFGKMSIIIGHRHRKGNPRPPAMGIRSSNGYLRLPRRHWRDDEFVGYLNLGPRKN